MTVITHEQIARSDNDEMLICELISRRLQFKAQYTENQANYYHCRRGGALRKLKIKHFNKSERMHMEITRLHKLNN